MGAACMDYFLTGMNRWWGAAWGATHISPWPGPTCISPTFPSASLQGPEDHGPEAVQEEGEEEAHRCEGPSGLEGAGDTRLGPQDEECSLE